MIRNRHPDSRLLALAVCLSLTASATAKIIYYVDANAPGGPNADGRSWATAFSSLTTALPVVKRDDEIRVARGVYRPTTSGFELGGADGVKIRGGYAGRGAAEPDARNIERYETILSGDLGNNDHLGIRSDNAFHVVDGSNTDEGTELDGFTICGGYADGGTSKKLEYKYGGGMYNIDARLTIRNCHFRDNYADPDGGAMYNKASEPNLIGCSFSQNVAKTNGGAICNIDSEPNILHGRFLDNRALNGSGGGIYNGNSPAKLSACAFHRNHANDGGGLYNYRSHPSLTNCLFGNNTAGSYGGAMYNDGSTPTLINCTLSGNSAAEVGGGLYSDEIPILRNCILWGNRHNNVADERGQIYMEDDGAPDVSYCCIQGWNGRWGGQGNFAAEPFFWGPGRAAGNEDDALRLLGNSPCIDQGDRSALPRDERGEEIPYDYSDQPRVSNEAVDLGAFEFQVGPIPGRAIYVDAKAPEGGDGRSWETAWRSLQDALRQAGEYQKDKKAREIRVAGGKYRPGGVFDWRGKTFRLINNVALKGGYAGLPSPNTPGPWVDPNKRDLHAYETILSGDLKDDDANVPDPRNLLAEPTRGDNCWNVVTAVGTDATAELEGFTITGGSANETNHTNGGGAYLRNGSPTIVQCTFRDNAALGDGGALYCRSGKPTIRACTLRRNRADRGAGIYCETASPTIQESIIANNQGTGRGAGIACCTDSDPLIEYNTIRGNKTLAEGGGIACIGGSGPRIIRNTIRDNTGRDGGGIYSNGGDPNIVSNLIVGNTARDDGGGICAINDDEPTEPTQKPQVIIRNNTLVQNRANPQGGGIYFDKCLGAVTNCILWANGDDFHNVTPVHDCNATYSCIQDGDLGPGNIRTYPHFVDWDNVDPNKRDYHLKEWSPCINAGWTPLEDPSLREELDFEETPRKLNGLVDMGADETTYWKGKSFDTDHDGLPDAWEVKHFVEGIGADPDADPDEDGYTNLDEYQKGVPPGIPRKRILYVSSAGSSDPQADGSEAHPFTSIQRAIDAADDRPDDPPEIRVRTGIFHERLMIDDKVLRLQGGYTTGFSSRIPYGTTIDADGTVEDMGRAVLYINVSAGLLSGFTITGGYEKDGGGIYLHESSPTISGNTITGNYAEDDGGGVSFYYGSRGRFENNRVESNRSGDHAGGIFCRRAAPWIHQCQIIGNTAADGGGAMRIRDGAKPLLTSCTIIGNSAGVEAGAIICREGAEPNIVDCEISSNESKSDNGRGGLVFKSRSHAVLKNCTMENNTSPGVWANESTLRIEGVVKTADAKWTIKDANLVGDGKIRAESATEISMDNCSLQCDLTGQAIITVELESELRIEGFADVNLVTDLGEKGRIDCDGLLYVRDHARIVGADVNVARASFEGDVDISNSVIHAEAGVPYGQFFVADTVTVSNSEIHADGDRYLDLDPEVFKGLIEKNRIYVEITEGIGHTRGGLFELRGLDRYGSPNESPEPFLSALTRVPDFNEVTWTIEELRLKAGAKLNLTNRFDFQEPYYEGGENEVLYVRNLILEPNAVLNTAFQKIYYESQDVQSGAVIENVPLLGFSLNNIAFDNENEFLTRVRHNNNESDPDNQRLNVQRVDDRKPDPNDGVMLMQNLLDNDPNSKTYGRNVQARAKGLFAKSNEKEIQIRFEYLFGDGDPAGTSELVVRLSNHPDLLDPNDPNHYLEVARVPQPPDERPGGAKSTQWGVFEQVVSVGNLSFVRGTRIELELRGPVGTWVLIDNWDPIIRCNPDYCGDVANPHFAVNEIDFLAALSECGRRIDAVVTLAGLGAPCLDRFFSKDGYVTVHDALGVDWASEKNLCDLKLSPDTGAVAASPPAFPGAGAVDLRDPVLVAAKGYPPPDGDVRDYVTDWLYGLDGSGKQVSGPVALDPNRFNGKLVRGPAGTLYELNLKLGLVCIKDGTVVVGPGSPEPPAGEPVVVYVGVQQTEAASWGRPLLDAAFDTEGYLYVVPVVVDPDLGEPYVAAAKLKLDNTGPNPGYRIEQLFHDPPPANDNPDLSQLREVEVDGEGNVYVLNCSADNSSDILWKFDSAGGLAGKRYLQDLDIRAPVGLCVSSHDTTRLYLSSSENPPDANRVNLYVLSTANLGAPQTIEIHGMGHVTDIAENPDSGTVYVVGFEMPRIPSRAEIQNSVNLGQAVFFYEPRLAIIPYDSDGPVDAGSPGGSDMALPLSIVYRGP